MLKDEIEILDGENFFDHRGGIASMNNLSFEGVERFYIIENADTEVLRGYHGHKSERKWFYCLSGSFTMSLVKIDDWAHPSKDLKPQIIRISAKKSQMVLVPAGFANCLRAEEPHSLLLVFSGRRYPECLDDSYRYDPNYWFDWHHIPRSK